MFRSAIATCTNETPFLHPLSLQSLLNVLIISGAPVNQLSTPCREKQHQIEAEWDLTQGDFPSYYFPHCDEEGVFWQVNNIFVVVTVA